MKKQFYVFILLLCGASKSFALPMTYDDAVSKWASNFGMDRLLMHALIQQESGHNPRICSPVGACGLMQLMVGTAGDLGVKDRFNPSENVRGGVTYIRQMIKMFDGNVTNGLRAYNWGPGNMRSYVKGKKKSMPRETKEYSERIKKYYFQYGGKGSHFGSGGTEMAEGGQGVPTQGKGEKNPNMTESEGKILGDASCKKVKLPDQEPVDLSKLPPLATPPFNPSAAVGMGHTVIDPTKISKIISSIAQAKRDYEMTKSKYAALVLGLQYFNLLPEVSSIAGFELPTNAPVWGELEGKGKVYLDISNRVGANSGVVAGGDLTKLDNAAANASNHAFVEAELAWTQSHCSINNLAALAAVETTTWKGAKDLSNRIAVEQALLMANKAKIESSMTVMSSAILAKEKIANDQSLRKYLN